MPFEIQEPKRQPSPWPGVISLLIICLTVVIVTWMLTR